MPTYVLLNEVQTSIVRHKSSNLLAVLDKLHTCALSDSRVGLLGLNTTAHHTTSLLPSCQSRDAVCSRVVKLTSSPKQSPWHEKLLQRASSTRFPSDSSCSPCLPIAAAFCGFEAYVQLPNLWFYCSESNKPLDVHLNRLGTRATMYNKHSHKWPQLRINAYPMFAN